MVTLSWGGSCLGTDTDYEIYEGTLGSFSSHAARSCGTGGATRVTLAPSPQSIYFLVVPRSFAREGSYGRGSDGVERPPAVSVCLPQESTVCP